MRRVALVLALALSSTLDASGSVAQSMDARRINVLGRATIEAVPDYATVTVGVFTRAATPTAALDKNSAVARQIIAFSSRFGVESRDVQTTSVQLQDVSESGLPRRTPTTEAERYEASNTVTVRIRSLPRFGEYMRSVLETGSNRINGVVLGLSNAERIADDARAAAVEDAARKAKRLAEAAGVKLGPLQQISDPPRVSYAGAGGVADMPRRLSTSSVPIELGTVDVSAEVDVTWLVE